jgi:DNA ligase (NAD+)
MNTQLLEQYRADTSSANKWSPEQMLSVIVTCDDHYYNTTTSLIPDNKYDYLREVAVNKGIPLDNHTGALPTGDLCKLPMYCGSADKIKAKSVELRRFISKFLAGWEATFVLSDKLDGMSSTYWRDEKGHHLASRGDGDIGTIWDHLLPYLNLPPLQVNDIVRGEILITLADFEALPVEEGKEKTSARHVTAGLVTKLEYDENWKLLKFIAFGKPSLDVRTSVQMNVLAEEGFTVVWCKYSLTSPDIIDDFLTDLESTYTTRREVCEFQIDGLIVTADTKYDLVSSGNPEHLAAFKMPLQEQMAETTVDYIEWNLSRYNVWIPRVKVHPVTIGGAVYNWCHGENARNLIRDGVGAGAKIILLRSGDVIPDIYEVLEKVAPQMPDGESEWSATEVDLVLPKGKTDATSEIKQLSHIMTEMGMAGMKTGTVKRLYEEGYTKLPELLNLDVRSLLDVSGIKERSAQSIFNQLQRVQTEGVPLFQLMASSAVFGRGFGRTKSQSVISTVPELINLQTLASSVTIVQRIANSEDFSEETAEKFVDCWNDFLAFIAEIPMVKVVNVTVNSGVLDGEVIVFTEYRNNDLEDLIELEGGQVGSSVTQKTTRVVTTNPTGTTGKLKKARTMELPIQSPEEFGSQFKLSW